MRQFRNYVGGEWRESARRFQDVNPADGTLVGEVHEADAATVDAAIRSGHAALGGTWGRTSVTERAALLYRIADEIERRGAEFLAAEIADTANPSPWHRPSIFRAAPQTSVSLQTSSRARRSTVI